MKIIVYVHNLFNLLLNVLVVFFLVRKNIEHYKNDSFKGSNKRKLSLITVNNKLLDDFYFTETTIYIIVKHIYCQRYSVLL